MCLLHQTKDIILCSGLTIYAGDNVESFCFSLIVFQGIFRLHTPISKFCFAAPPHFCDPGTDDQYAPWSVGRSVSRSVGQ